MIRTLWVRWFLVLSLPDWLQFFFRSRFASYNWWYRFCDSSYYWCFRFLNWPSTIFTSISITKSSFPFIALISGTNLARYALTLENRIRKHLMLALALMQHFTAFLVGVFIREHFVEEISIIVLFFSIANCGRVILNDLFIFDLHEFLSTL